MGFPLVGQSCDIDYIVAAMDIIERKRVSLLCVARVQVWRNCRKRGSNGGVTLTLAFAFGDEPTRRSP